MHAVLTFLALLSCVSATCGCARPLRSCASTVLVIGPADLSLQCPPQGRAAAIKLIELHGPDGQTAYVNEAEISSLRAPTASDLARHFPATSHCIVVTTNGRFVAVQETCSQVRDLLK